MRLTLLCTALCIACPIESSAELWSGGKFRPKETSFAYAASHAATEPGFRARIGLRPSGTKLSELIATAGTTEEDTPDPEPRIRTPSGASGPRAAQPDSEPHSTGWGCCGG